MALSSDKNEAPLNSYRFGEFELGLEEEALFRSGERLNVPRRAIQVLGLLLERRGEIVSKDEFFEKVWGGTFVEENNLTVVIASLRKALGDNAKEGRYIQNLPRKGYRFVAPVTVASPAHVPKNAEAPDLENFRRPPRPRLILLAGSGIALVTLIVAAAGFSRFLGPTGPNLNSVVVLPFLFANENQEYLADGLTLGVVANLSRHSGLRVIDNRSLKESEVDLSDPSEAARKLNSAAVVTGRVELDGDVLLVSAELRATSDSRILWQQKFRRRAVDLYSIENEIAQSVAETLNVSPPAPLVPLSRQTNDPVAYDLYLRGRHHWNKRTEPDFLKAAELYRQAVDRDPTFAAAYVGLAEAYSLGRFEKSAEERNAIVRGHIEKALEIDDTISEAYAARALNKCYHDWDLASAEADYLKAIELNPNNATARHWYADLLAIQGRFDESFAEYERAMSLDPLSLAIKTDTAFNYFYSRDYDTAIKLLNAVVDQAPHYHRTYLFLSQVYKEKGMFDEAVSALEKLHDLKMASGEWKGSDSGERKRFITELRAAVKKSGALGYWRTEANFGPEDYNLKAVAHAKLGENDKAFEWLETALRNRATGLVWLKVSPDLDGLRSDPRFADLMQRTGLFR